MNSYAITIKTKEKKGVLVQITDIISSFDINISFVNLFIDKKDIAFVNLELEDVNNITSLIEKLNTLDSVLSVNIHRSANDIFGKRILIYGGGAQVSQVALGAITEADRHNIRGERISVDTLPVVGEDAIAEAVNILSRTPRVKVLVLAGSLMGGKIVEEIKKLKKFNDLIVFSLNMPGGVTEVSDLVLTDPIQAGVMAVMQVADTAVFDYRKLPKDKRLF
jgi:energy-converting hydrogenase B subunit Q